MAVKALAVKRATTNGSHATSLEIIRHDVAARAIARPIATDPRHQRCIYFCRVCRLGHRRSPYSGERARRRRRDAARRRRAVDGHGP